MSRELDAEVAKARGEDTYVCTLAERWSLRCDGDKCHRWPTTKCGFWGLSSTLKPYSIDMNRAMELVGEITKANRRSSFVCGNGINLFSIEIQDGPVKGEVFTVAYSAACDNLPEAICKAYLAWKNSNESD